MPYPPILSQMEIDDLKATQEEMAMVEPCTVYYKSTITEDEQPLDVWNEAYQTTCRRSPARAVDLTNEGISGDTIRTENFWVITLPEGSIVFDTSRIEIGTKTYDVEMVQSERTWENAVRLITTEVR